MTEYIHPDVLVSIAWVAEHRNDPNIRIVESDEDILLYDVGHIPGAIKVDWQSELQHQVVRDYIDKDAFGRLIGSKGIRQDHTVVFYGDRNNWWACYAFWVFKMYGHGDCRIMNGGRQKWLDEDYLIIDVHSAKLEDGRAALASELLQSCGDQITRVVRGELISLSA